MKSRGERNTDDAGLTLVELIMYLSLSVIVGTIVVTMFINTIKGEQTVTSVTRATTDGQLAAQLIEKSLRNATAVAVDENGTRLRMVTTLDDECQAWRVAAVTVDGKTTDALQHTNSPGDESSWSTFVPRVAPVVEDDGGHETPLSYFAAEGAVRYAFSVESNAAPVIIRGGIVPRSAGGNLEAAC